MTFPHSFTIGEARRCFFNAPANSMRGNADQLHRSIDLEHLPERKSYVEIDTEKDALIQRRDAAIASLRKCGKQGQEQAAHVRREFTDIMQKLAEGHQKTEETFKECDQLLTAKEKVLKKIFKPASSDRFISTPSLSVRREAQGPGRVRNMRTGQLLRPTYEVMTPNVAGGKGTTYRRSDAQLKKDNAYSVLAIRRFDSQPVIELAKAMESGNISALREKLHVYNLRLRNGDATAAEGRNALQSIVKDFNTRFRNRGYSMRYEEKNREEPFKLIKWKVAPSELRKIQRADASLKRSVTPSPRQPSMVDRVKQQLPTTPKVKSAPSTPDNPYASSSVPFRARTVPWEGMPKNPTPTNTVSRTVPATPAFKQYPNAPAFPAETPRYPMPDHVRALEQTLRQELCGRLGYEMGISVPDASWRTFVLAFKRSSDQSEVYLALDQSPKIPQMFSLRRVVMHPLWKGNRPWYGVPNAPNLHKLISAEILATMVKNYIPPSKKPAQAQEKRGVVPKTVTRPNKVPRSAPTSAPLVTSRMKATINEARARKQNNAPQPTLAEETKPASVAADRGEVRSVLKKAERIESVVPAKAPQQTMASAEQAKSLPLKALNPEQMRSMLGRIEAIRERLEQAKNGKGDLRKLSQDMKDIGRDTIEAQSGKNGLSDAQLLEYSHSPSVNRCTDYFLRQTMAQIATLETKDWSAVLAVVDAYIDELKSKKNR